MVRVSVLQDEEEICYQQCECMDRNLKDNCFEIINDEAFKNKTNKNSLEKGRKVWL